MEWSSFSVKEKCNNWWSWKFRNVFISDLSSAVTGEIHYVDSGFNIMGMPAVKFDEEGNQRLLGMEKNSQ